MLSLLELNEIDAVILAGGLGTRLRGVIGERAKPMAMIRDRPFLDILVENLKRGGLQRFILCVGHRREQIIAHYRSRNDASYVFSVEHQPLGTGGAVRAAASFVRSDPFLVLNGDSFCAVDYGQFLSFHREKAAALSIVIAPARGRADGGTIELAADFRITRFREKAAIKETRRTFINAGIYLMRRNLPASWSSAVPSSLERDIFPELAEKEKCYGFVVDTEVVDIGTPERYVEAQRKL